MDVISSGMVSDCGGGQEQLQVLSNSTGKRGPLYVDTAYSLSSAQLSDAYYSEEYVYLPPENIDFRDYASLSRPRGRGRQQGSLYQHYTQVLIWCISHRLESLGRAVSNGHIDGTTVTVLRVLERLRRSLVEGSIRTNMTFKTPISLKPLIRNPINVKRLRIIKGLESCRDGFNKELKDGLRLLKHWERNNELRDRSSGHPSDTAHPLEYLSALVSHTNSLHSESQAILSSLLSVDSLSAEARLLSQLYLRKHNTVVWVSGSKCELHI